MNKAMKVMAKDDESAENELYRFVSLNHPNIVTFYDHFELMNVIESLRRHSKLCIVAELCQVSYFKKPCK